MGEKDLFYDLLANPLLALGDLETVGHSSENSRLLSKDFYKNNEKVRAEFTKEDGTFDEKAFDQLYAIAAYYWKGMTDDTYNKNLIKYTAFDKDNIFVEQRYRTLDNSPKISKAPNVTRDTWGLIEVNKQAPSGKSIDEIALAEKVLLNPVEVEKGADPIWGESPNEEWWSNPFSTRVLAKYDSAGYHTDAVTGEKVWHEKDEFKINSNGTHYYEALDGRDIYGRQVLNKLNTLTTDGSWWNQYDFLDSDDLNQKSVAGSVAKNLALVGSMFIPYVGWGVAAASVLTQMAGLTGTFGKMITGSDNSVLSGLEGFAKSWNRQGAKTQYALQNMMCWENFIDLIGDTTAQLREQRAIFKFVPAIFKGKYGMMGKKGQNLYEAKKMNEFREMYSNKNIAELAKEMYKSGNPPEYIKKVLTSGEFEGLMKRASAKELETYLKEYNKIGELIARAYMVGITVGDTFGEAKAAGASDGEAALLTIGYAAMENALLNTDLGKWIFPELKGEKLKYKSIAKAFASLPDEVKLVSVNLRKLDKELTKDWMKRLFNAGMEAAKKDYSLLNKTAGTILANGLGEGVEEVSEEALADFSKACFNVYREVSGQDALMDTWGHNWNWDEAAKRYGMSFAGGIIGGGINAGFTDFDQTKTYSNMTRELAMEHLTWMARNNELGAFWDTVNKMELGNSKLGTKLNADGTWEIGTKNDNQDVEVKKLLKGTLQRIQNIVNAEGANIDDASLIGNLIKLNPKLAKYDLIGQLRTEAISQSTAAGKLVKNYNTIIKNIIKELLAIDAIYGELLDHEKLSKKQEEEIALHTTELTKLRKLKEDILNGELTNDLVRRSLYEATYQLAEGFTTATELQYVRKRLEGTGKNILDLTEDEKKEWHKKYVLYAKSDKADDIEFFADWYWDIAQKTSVGILLSMDYLTKLKDKLLPELAIINTLASKSLDDILSILNDGGEALDVYDYLAKLTMSERANKQNIQEMVNAASSIDNDPIASQTFDTYNSLKLLLAETTDELEKTNLEAQISEIETNYPDIKTFNTDASLKVSRVTRSLGSYDILLKKLDQIFEDPKYSAPSERDNALRMAVFDTVIQDVLDTVEEAKAEGFIHPEAKNILNEALDALSWTMTDYMGEANTAEDLSSSLFSNDDYIDFLMDLDGKIKSAKEDLKNLNSTPLYKILKDFTTSLQTEKSVEDLLIEALNLLIDHKKDLENATLDEPTLFDYELALKVLLLVRQGIIGARTDAVDLGNLFGYNKTLNELYTEADGYQKLAEIDKETAEYALLDINLAIQRLNTMRNLHEVNSGNKLNALNQASVNKSLIMYNRVNRLITSIRDDKDKLAIRDDGWDFSAFQDVLENMPTHKEAWGDELKNPAKNVSERKLNLGKDARILLEKEAIIMENALFDFFDANIDKVKDPTKLAKILDSFNYFNINSGILTRDSQDIDDNAFTWWLASRAALRASDFSAVSSRVIDGPEVERPIAPIPTQELGIYAGVAAIFNGDMFRYFADAMTHSIYNKWKNMSTKEKNAALTNGKLLKTVNGRIVAPLNNADSNDPNYDFDDIYNSDLIPNYVNILFIEGIAGSGKSTGCFKTIMRILDNQNPELAGGKKLSDYPIFFAHGSKKNADDAVADFGQFNNSWDFRTFDKKELFSHFTDDYKAELTPDGEYKYILGEDVVISNHRYKSNWKIKNFSNPNKEVPKVMFIDEWSHYTLPEIAFLQLVSDELGIQIISGGDLDQITPRAVLYNDKGDFEADMTIDRNSFPRMQKLGVSMRTGNGLKTENQNRVRAWEDNKKLPIELMHLEVDGQLFGDKVYRAGKKLLPKLMQELKADILKLVASLSPGEKIGYIWYDLDSELYKLINSEFKDKFDFYEAKDAQGREARFYVVENNRELTHLETAENGKHSDAPNNPDDYYKTFYTGLTRASQGSIIIAPEAPIGNEILGTIEVLNARNQPTKLIPDGYSSAGLKKYTLSRKEGTTAAWEAVKEAKGFKETIDLVNLTYVPRTIIKNDVKPDSKPTAAEKLADEDTTSTAESQPEVASETNAETQSETTEILQENSQLQEPEKIETSKENSEETETETETKPEEPVILSRDTELYDGDRFLGAVVSYDENSKNYTLTLDGRDENNYEISYDEVNQWLTQGVETMSPEEAKINGYVGLLAVDEATPYKGDYPIGTEIYDSSNELVGMISGFDGINYTVIKNGTSTPISKDDLEVPFAYSIGRRASNEYKQGDVLTNKLNQAVYTIEEVIPLRNGGYNYKLKIKYPGEVEREETLNQVSIKNSIDNGDFVLNPKNDPLDLELGIESGSLKDFEQSIEEVLDKTEGADEELVDVKKNNIKFSILGHTFNTFYTGLTYEDTPNGKKLKVPQEGELGFDRIDMGLGLYKIGEEYCKTEQKVIQILGGIRSAAMFLKDNNDLIGVIKALIPTLQNEELEIKYAWVSKSKIRNNKKYARDNDRFTPATDGKLRNMPEGDENKAKKEEVPVRAFSLIIRRKGDKEASLLEIPMITLSSPQTILYKIGKLDSKNGAYRAFIDKAMAIGNVPGLLYEAINAVMEYIKKNKATLGDGYKKLNALCKMWLFNNDGIRFVGGVNEATFNFARAFQNLGVKYVKERIVEEPLKDPKNPPKYSYKGKWHELYKEVTSRPEVLYSSIMMSTELGMTFNGLQINIAAPGHPFVLRYEAPVSLVLEKTDEAMLNDYINLLADPDKPKLVKLIYVSPPECSVSEYLKGMLNLEKNPYGNSFSAYHILSALYKYAKKNDLDFWNAPFTNFDYNGKKLGDLNKAILTLDLVVADNPKLAGDSQRDYITKITKALKQIMKDNPEILPMLNNALISIAFPNIYGKDRFKNNDDRLKKIQDICEKAKITGILRKKQAQAGDRVAGYALKLVVDSTNKYKSPEGNYWRIFSKFDSPTFDVSEMINHEGGSMLESWSNLARFNSNSNIWYFLTKNGVDPQKAYYFAGGINEETEEVPIALQLITKHSNLLGKLGINSDNTTINSVTSEEEFWQKVVECWINQKDENGLGQNHIGMIFLGNKPFFGIIDDTKALKKLDEERKHLIQVGNIEKSEAEPNKYMITMENNEGTKYLFNITINPDEETYEVDYIENTIKAEKASTSDNIVRLTSEQLLEVKQKVSTWAANKNMNDISQKVLEIIDKYFDNGELVNPPTEFELAVAIVDAFGNDSSILKKVGLALGKGVGYFKDLNALKLELEKEDVNETSKDSLEEEINICPISLGVKKFI